MAIHSAVASHTRSTYRLYEVIVLAVAYSLMHIMEVIGSVGKREGRGSK